MPAPINSPSNLLERYSANRDADAFAQIVTQYQCLVFASCRRILRNPNDVEDAVQETFLRLAQKASGLRTNLGAWLHASARNISIDINRRHASRSRCESSVVPQAASAVDPQNTLAELREHLDAALQKLTPTDRELIIQRYFVGRQQVELAKDAGVAPSTISYRIEQAVEALRKHLKGLGCGIAVAGSLATILEAEHATAAVPATLTTNVMKIGLTGVNGGAISLPFLTTMLMLGLSVLAPIGVWLFLIFGPASPAAQAPLSSSPAPVATALHGRILAPDGSPVNGATVLVATSAPSNIRIRNGKLEDDDPKTPRAITNSNGDYELPPQPGRFLLQVISDAGYGIANQTLLAKNPDIRLVQWGRIRGRLMIGTKPGAGIQLQAYAVDQLRGGDTRTLSMVNRARTDADGNFTMDRVAPGLIQIERSFEQASGTNSMVFFGDVGTAQVMAGQTKTATLGGVGRPVVGKFVFPSGMEPIDYFINARSFPIADAGSGTPAYFLNVDARHNFQIDNVLPGTYRIHIVLQRVHGDRSTQPTLPTFTMPNLPGGVSDEPLTIPDIQLQPDMK
jgi:RNA polymerase sigma factor (sigma-70 family)